MLKLTLEEIIEAVTGQVIYKGNEIPSIKKVSIDTRTIEDNSLFIAIKGERFNGNLFAEEASKKGAVISILEEVPNYSLCNYNTTVILVQNTKVALQALAAFYRNKLGVKVIGVTGSTGKTSTKDIIAAVLSTDFKVYKTLGNYNNDIGLPLSILAIEEGTEICVLEMGMNHLKEIHLLAEIARPDIAVITNIGISHIENLRTQDNIFKAKMEITDFFNKDSILIVNGDDDYLRKIVNMPYKVVKAGLEEGNDLRALNVISLDESMKFSLEVNNHKKEMYLPLLGVHNVKNTMLALVLGRELGISFENMELGLENLQKTSMRLEVMKKDKITVINDCYNASPTSMESAFQVQLSLKGKRRVAILGYMAELGAYEKKAHIDTAAKAKALGIDMILTLENCGEYYKEGFGENTIITSSMEELISKALSILKPEDVILIKASRRENFEKITNAIIDSLN